MPPASPGRFHDPNPRAYRNRICALLMARGREEPEPEPGPPPGVDPEASLTVEQAATLIADNLDMWVEAIQGAEADKSPADDGYWTTLNTDLEELLGPAELGTGIFQDLWSPLLTGLRLRGLDTVARELTRLAKQVVPKASELAGSMNAVAYLTHGGPEDVFYNLYSSDDLVTHQLCLRDERREVTRDVVTISRTLRTLSQKAEAPDAQMAGPKNDSADVEGLPAEIAPILQRGDFPVLSDDEYAKLGAWLTANARKHYDGMDPANVAKTRRMEEAKTRLRAIYEYNITLRQPAAPAIARDGWPAQERIPTMPTHAEVELRSQIALDVNRLLLETSDGRNLRRFRQQVDLQIQAIEQYDKAVKKGINKNMQDPMRPDFLEPRLPMKDQAELLPMQYTILAVIHDAFAQSNTNVKFLPDDLPLSVRLAFVWEDNECFEDNRLQDAMVAVKADLASRLAGSKEQPWADDAPEYLPLTEARKLIDGCLSVPTLSRLCKPDGEMRYMRKGQRRKVHLGDFRRFMQSRPNDPKWALALAAYFSASGKGTNRRFWLCSQCGHEYPDTAMADPDCCPKCKHKGKSNLVTKAPPKPRR